MLIQLNNAHKNYGKGDNLVKALDGLSLEVAAGEMLAVMGKSGSGKTTLLNVLGALDAINDGDYLFDGRRMEFKNQDQMARFRYNKIGFIVQNFALIDHQTVYDNVALPLRYSKMPRRAIKDKVMDSLAEFGLQDRARRHPYELSGGQCQRVAIARALINDPALLLADEPTGALDSQSEDEIMDILERLHRQGKTMIIVTHDLKMAERCQRTVTIRDGKNMA